MPEQAVSGRASTTTSLTFRNEKQPGQVTARR